MRICHVMSGGLWAGAEVMGYRLLAGLAGKPKVVLSSVLMNEGELARKIRTLGVPIDIVDETHLDFFQIKKRIYEILMRKKPDIVHTHGLKENILGYLVSRKAGLGIPLVCTQHGLDEPQRSLKRKLLSIANRYILSKKFQKIVVVSEGVRITLNEKFGFPARRLVVIPNGTEIPNCIKADNGNRPFTIGSAGRLFPVKDYPLFVDIAAEVNKQAKDIRFELAGEGPDHARLLEQIRKYGLQDVFCLKGFVGGMSEFYMGLDLYINTSLHEGSPMSVLEAMSHGLPVIAPKEGGIAEMVKDGLHGFLVERRDPKRFAEKCLAIYRDRNLGKSMGIASREKVVTEYSFQSMADRYLELYLKALAQPR